MGKFDKYTGKITLDVDGDQFIITPTNKHIARFMALDKDKIQTEAGLVGLTDALIDMFVKAYPTEPKDKIDAFVLRNMDSIVTEIVIKMGWSTKEELEKATNEQGKAIQGEKKG
jgi:hypothetical protein